MSPVHHLESRPLTRFPLPADPLAGKQARILASRILADWDMEHMLDTVLLIVSELVTNAIREREVFWFSLVRHGDAALIEITDNSFGVPKVKPVDIPKDIDDLEEGGRGMLLVETLSEDWGCRTNTDGTKTTWVRVVK